jgi:hypothetical protein
VSQPKFVLDKIRTRVGWECHCMSNHSATSQFSDLQSVLIDCSVVSFIHSTIRWYREDFVVASPRVLAPLVLPFFFSCIHSFLASSCDPRIWADKAVHTLYKTNHLVFVGGCFCFQIWGLITPTLVAPSWPCVCPFVGCIYYSLQNNILNNLILQ